MSVPFIDLKTQYQALKKDIDARIQKVLDHGQFILGPEVEECEKLMAKYVGAKHAITCSSGTDAAIIAMMALDIGPGDEVITPAFSFIATAETILLVGATPVYVDIDPVTYNVDVKEVERAITPRTKAIMPVALYGQPADMNELNDLAKRHNLTVIEDAAQSFGATYNKRRSCNLSTIGCTSFFPAKPLGCYGDGGAIFTNDDKLAEVMKQIRAHGQESRYHHVRIGVNGRLDTLQCAILIPKLERFPWELEQRQRIAHSYSEAFQPLVKKGLTPPVVKADRSCSWAQYTVRVQDRAQFQERMKAMGVPTVIHYPGTMPDQPAYRDKGICKKIDQSRLAAQQVVSLPIYPDMPDDLAMKVIEATINSL